jgi:flagellar protein FliT
MSMPNLIDYYRAIELVSERMLSYAEVGQWEDMAVTETTCGVLISQLRLAAQNAALTRDERQERSRIMRRILRNDARIRVLTEPCLESIDQALSVQSAPMLTH